MQKLKVHGERTTFSVHLELIILQSREEKNHRERNVFPEFAHSFYLIFSFIYFILVWDYFVGRLAIYSLLYRKAV